MVKSGIVISVNKAEKSGIIQDARKQEWFFSIEECVENELPPIYTTVTFIKDPDYKSTNVASLIKRSEVFKNIKSA